VLVSLDDDYFLTPSSTSTLVLELPLLSRNELTVLLWRSTGAKTFYPLVSLVAPPCRLNSTSNATRTSALFLASRSRSPVIYTVLTAGLAACKRTTVARAHSLELRDLRELHGQAMLGEEELCDVLARFCDASDAPNQGHALSIDALIRALHKPSGLVGVDCRDLRLSVLANL
jgi:hypothetical protein